MNLTRSLALCALVTVAAVASAQKVTLRYNPPVGKTYTYSMSVVTGASGMAMGASMGMTETATSTMKILSRSGDATKVSVTTSNVKINVPANSPMKSQVASMEKTAATTMSMTISSLGAISNVSTSGGNAMVQMSGDMMSAAGPYMAMPKAPVGPGSTWSSSLDLAKAMGKSMPAGMKVSGGKIPLNMKLVKFVSMGGKKLAQIDMTGAGKASLALGGGGKGMNMTIDMSLKSSSMVDLATGLAVSMTSNMSNKMSMGAQGSMTQTMKMSMKLK